MIKPVDRSEDAPHAGGDETLDVVAETEAFFGPDTPLRRAPEVGGRPYEARPQQRDMAVRVAAALASGQHLCVEAPTGVGKTFAYLIPALLFALRRGEPVVISTHTISLQEQIIDKDVPVLRQLLGREFRAVLAKGRANYLCLRRLHAACEQHQDYLPAPELVPELEQLRLWAAATTDGSRSGLDAEPSPTLWEAVNCEVGNCLGGSCPFYNPCFFMRARAALFGATLVVTNHALFFSDLRMKRDAEDAETAAGILPRCAAAILDEGHTIEDTAATHLGLRVTSFGLRRILHRLYNPERGRGLLSAAACAPARLAATRALEAADRFFAGVHARLDQVGANPWRQTAPGTLLDLVSEPLETARDAVERTAAAETEPGRKQELAALARQLYDYRESFHVFVNMTEPDFVYWLERQGSRGRILSFNAVPVEVNGLLRGALFGEAFPVVVTSATLSVRQSMEYLVRRVGAQGAETLILDSPFNFQEQVRLYVPYDMPNPNDTARFIPAACAHLRQFLLQTQGHAFVLFTSYKMMQDVAVELADFFHESRLRLLMQGEGLPRGKLLESFRQTPNAVLFGTDSFWTGVDVPGEALINVIIVKLPFSVPDHPLVEARQELIERRGGRAFEQYTLPEAILKFRQGFGRLIRSRDDHGIVVVLDNRITRSWYGKAFLESLPVCRRLLF